jgi:nucleoside-diphosphate-sugar epimerase
MAEGDGKTVLVTGGSGYLATWCIVDLLQRGYRVRTTVRNPSRERDVHAAVESQVGPGPHLTVHQADLTSDEHWDNVIEGCDYVLHVASPFPPKQPKDPDELIVPAREGTLRVLGKALDHGVKRVVVTSSIAAVRLAKGAEKKTLTEEDWTDPDEEGLTPYVRSKTIAERAAWDLVKERGAEDRLAVVNPGAIIGPVLNDDLSYSIQAIERLLKGMPGMPRLGFSFVDVRDVADLEIRAMTAPEAGGQRFIAVTKFLWMSDTGEILRDRLGEGASKVPTRTIPDFVVRGMALFDGGIRSIVGTLGKRSELSSEKARSTLGWSPRPIEDTITETGETLIEHGVVPAPAKAA